MDEEERRRRGDIQKDLDNIVIAAVSDVPLFANNERPMEMPLSEGDNIVMAAGFEAHGGTVALLGFAKSSAMELIFKLARSQGFAIIPDLHGADYSGCEELALAVADRLGDFCGDKTGGIKIVVYDGYEVKREMSPCEDVGCRRPGCGMLHAGRVVVRPGVSVMDDDGALWKFDVKDRTERYERAERAGFRGFDAEGEIEIRMPGEERMADLRDSVNFATDRVRRYLEMRDDLPSVSESNRLLSEIMSREYDDAPIESLLASLGIGVVSFESEEETVAA